MTPTPPPAAPLPPARCPACAVPLPLAAATHASCHATASATGARCACAGGERGPQPGATFLCRACLTAGVVVADPTRADGFTVRAMTHAEHGEHAADIAAVRTALIDARSRGLSEPDARSWALAAAAAGPGATTDALDGTGSGGGA